MGVAAVKIESECLREGSENDGVPVGLLGGSGGGEGLTAAASGGKSIREESVGTTGEGKEGDRASSEEGISSVGGSGGADSEIETGTGVSGRE